MVEGTGSRGSIFTADKMDFEVSLQSRRSLLQLVKSLFRLDYICGCNYTSEELAAPPVSFPTNVGDTTPRTGFIFGRSFLLVKPENHRLGSGWIRSSVSRRTLTKFQSREYSALSWTDCALQ
jgi:hypothetical protein